MLVTSYCGRSLSDLSRPFFAKSLMMCGVQLLGLLEAVHAQGFLMRVLRPESIGLHAATTANSNFNHLGLLDLRFARPFRGEDGVHLASEEVSSEALPNVPAFLLPRCYREGKRGSRRDDLEALGRLLLLLGSAAELPGREGYDLLEELLQSPRTLTSVRALFDAAAALAFERRPDYSALRAVFLNELRVKGLALDYVYDWDLGSAAEQASLQKRRANLAADARLLARWESPETAELLCRDVRESYDFTAEKNALLMLFRFDEVNLLDGEVSGEDENPKLPKGSKASKSLCTLF